MSDRKRYIAGVVSTIIFHLIFFLAIGLAGSRFLKTVPGIEVLQVTLDSGEGKSKAGGNKGNQKSQTATNNKKTANEAIKTENSYENTDKTNHVDEEDKSDDLENETEESGNSYLSGTGDETGQGSSGDGGNNAGESSGDGAGEGGGVPVTPPKAIHTVLPVYPYAAKRDELTGVTYVTAYVNASGSVDSVSIAQSSGNRDLDNSAVEAAYQWTFTPALDKYGVPSACQITFPIEFKLH